MKIRSVLVVDNNPLIVEMLSALLLKEGYEVFKAGDGLEALDLLEGIDSLPDMILLDLVMPKIDGRRFTRILKNDRRFSSVPIVILSGIAAEEYGSLLPVGADAHIAKGKIEDTFEHVVETIRWLEERQEGSGPREAVMGVEKIYPREMTHELLIVKEHHDSMLNFMQEGVLELDHEHRILMANPAACRLMETEDHSLFGRNVKDLFSGNEELTSYLDRLSREHTGSQEKMRITRGLDVLQLSLSPFFHEGRHLGSTMIIADITALVKREEELQVMMSAVVRHAPVGLCLISHEGRILMVNPSFSILLGHGPGWNPVEESCDSTLLSQCPPLGPLIERGFDLPPGEVLSHTIDHRPADPGNRMVLNVIISVLESGGRSRLLVVIEDVTEKALVQQELQERINEGLEMETALMRASDEWRTTFDSTGDIIVVTDIHSRVIRVNKSTSLFFQQSYGELLMQEFYDLFAGWEVSSDEHPLRRMRRSGRREQAEASVPEKGTEWLLPADPILGEDGEMKGAVFTARDITERKKAEEEARKLEGDLLHMQKMDSIGRLAGGVAHDFNNLLSSIIGYSEIGLARIDDRKVITKALRVISAASEKASMLTQQLLSFSRKQILQREVLDLSAIVMEMSRMLMPTMKKNVKIVLQLKTPLRGTLADKTQIEQVLLNLVVNGRDAMPEGGSLTIATSVVTVETDSRVDHPGIEQGKYVLLTVADTGMGIPPEVQERMFEPFFTTKEKSKGTGLGLATVYGIVDQHGGHIRVRSKAGKGTIFSVYLPVCEAMPLEAQLQEEDDGLEGKERILVVDDEPMIRTLVRDILEPLGYSVHAAPSGEEALAMCDGEGNFDLLLTDIMMPGMTGRELSDQFREKCPDTRVAMMSGYIDDPESMQEYLDAGIPLLRKPLTRKKLPLAIRAIFDSVDSPPPEK